MVVITSAFFSENIVFISSIFYSGKSLIINSATLELGDKIRVGDKILVEYWLGSHLSFQILIDLPFPTNQIIPAFNRDHLASMFLQTYDVLEPNFASIKFVLR